MSDDPFDFGFQITPGDLEILTEQLVDVAQQVNGVMVGMTNTAKEVIDAERAKLSPITRKIGDHAPAVIQSERTAIRSIVDTIPQSMIATTPGVVLDRPIDPQPPLPPVRPDEPPAKDTGVYQVWYTFRCYPGNLRKSVTYVVGPGYPDPPADAVLCRGGFTLNEAIAAAATYCKLADQQDFTCNTGDEPPVEPPPEPPTEPEPPSEPPTCPKCCANPCGCGCDKPEPPKDDYCVWVGGEPRECLVLSADQVDPPKPGFKKVKCVPTRQEAEDIATMLCDWKDPDVTPPTPPPVGQSLPFCDSAVWSSSELASRFASFASLASDEGLKRGATPKDIASGLSWLLSSVVPPPWNMVVRSTLDSALNNIIQLFGSPVDAVAAVSGCQTADVSALSGMVSFLSIIEKWVGRIPPRISAPIQYAEAYQCPWLIPSPAEARSMFLSGVIDEETMLVLGRLGATCPDAQSLLAAAGQRRLSPIEIVNALRRNLLNEQDAREELRANGYLYPYSLDLQVGLSRFIPGPPDLVRFLVRDASDKGIVQRFGLDDEFDRKTDDPNGIFLQWAAAQGVDLDTLRYYWRAHWTIPSPTQLGEFHRRLRPAGPIDPARAARIGLSGSIPSWSPRSNSGLVVSPADIDAALAQQDILPFWRDKFVSVQNLPLTRTDARRAYDIGVLGIDDVYESLIQDGYSDENAGILAEFASKEKQLGIRNNEAARSYTDGLIDEPEARAELANLGYHPETVEKFIVRSQRARRRAAQQLPEYLDYVAGIIDQWDLTDALLERSYSPEEINYILGIADRRLAAKFRGDCTSAIETRFFWGELDSEQARKELRNIDWPATVAEKIVAGWTCKLATSERLPTLRQLLQWLEVGVLSPDDFRARMRKLRYSSEDADRVLAQAAIRIQLAADKEADKRAAEEQKRLERERKAKERQLARSTAAQEKALKAIVVEKNEEERVALLITRAATKFATKFDQSFEAVNSRVRAMLTVGANEYDLSDTTSAKSIVQAIDWLVANESDELETAIDLYFQEVDRAAAAAKSTA